MTATPGALTKKMAEPAAEERVAEELPRQAREQRACPGPRLAAQAADEDGAEPGAGRALAIVQIHQST